MNDQKALRIAAFIYAIVLALVIGIYAWQAVYFRLPAFSVEKIDEEYDNFDNLYDKFDILLLGIDSRETIDIGARTDTMIVASFDTTNNTCNMLSIPRDTRVKYKNSWMKINAAYFYDEEVGAVTAVNTLLGTNVDRYAVVDFSGVIELVDMFDGIDVEVPFKMYKPEEGIDLEPGYQHLDGAQTLAFMRYRDSVHSDFERSDRQKQVLSLVAQKVLDNLSLSKIPDLYEAFTKYVDTDLSLGEMGGLAKIGLDVLNNGITSSTLPGDGGFIGDGWYYVAFTSELGLPANEAELELAEKGWTKTTTSSTTTSNSTDTDIDNPEDITEDNPILQYEFIYDEEGNIIDVIVPEDTTEALDEDLTEEPVTYPGDGSVALDEDPK